MNFSRYEKIKSYRANDLIRKKLELTPYQAQLLVDRDFWEDEQGDIIFFQQRKPSTKNAFYRASVIFLPLVWVVLFLGLIINFILTGHWGYESKTIAWFNKWLHNLNL